MADRSADPRTWRHSLAHRMLALFLLASLLPLALSAWVSTSATSQVANQLSVDARAQTTRQVSRQVLERLLVGKTLLSALRAVPETSVDPGRDLPDLALVFTKVASLRPDAASEPPGTPSELHRHWAEAQAQAAGYASARRGASTSTQHVQIRVHAQGSATLAIMLGAIDAQGQAGWVGEFDPAYLWQPLSHAGHDARWTVSSQADAVLATIQGEDYAAQAAAADTMMRSRAQLFLDGEFAAPPWLFEQTYVPPAVLWYGQRLSVWLVMLAAATLLVVALLARQQIRRMLGPLKSLTDGTRMLSAGARRAAIDVQGNDELGALATSFNEMALRLEMQFDSLRALASIDREILAGMPFDHLAELTARELAALYPGALASARWVEDDELCEVHCALRSWDRRATPEVRSTRLRLNPAQVEAFRAWHAGAPLGKPGAWPHPPDAQQAASTSACAAGIADPSRRHALQPIVHEGRTQAVLSLEFAGPPPSADQLDPANELRDRLAVAHAAQARERELVYRAVHDTLTGLTNRYGLASALASRLDAAAGDAPLGLLMIDLDHFKDVNDTGGHDVGDELLCIVARRLLDTVPASALVARQGGDEFAVVLSMSDPDLAGRVADEAIAAMRAPFCLRSSEFTLGASVGIAVSDGSGLTGDELLRRADVALYVAKGAGRGRWAHFRPEMDEAAQGRLQLASELRRAIEGSEFVAYFQPRVSVADGQIGSAEALIRWQHPTRGLLFPDSFIGPMESCGLIEAVGAWMLDAACAQFAAWRAAGLSMRRISVNVSPQQLTSGALMSHVQRALERHQVPASALELEITESLFVGDTEHACAQLQQLRDAGVLVALDDFGTGYSSLSVLRTLPIDVMKIDRAFVQDLPADTSAMAIVRTIVTLAKSLHMHLVAEGVETQAQASLLRDLGCDELQGYFYSKPVPPLLFAALPRVQHAAPAATHRSGGTATPAATAAAGTPSPSSRLPAVAEPCAVAHLP